MKDATKAKEVSKDAAVPEKRGPYKSLRVEDVSASIWARERQISGEIVVFYSVTFERSYRDAAGKYGYSRSFDPDDLGALMSLCRQAGDYVLELQGMTAATAED